MLTILNENQPVRSVYQSSFLGEENAIQPTSGWTRAQTFWGVVLVLATLSWLFKWPHIYIRSNPEGFPLKGEEIPDDQFDPVQLEKGVQVELEHTDDAQVAKAIAKAHLLEDSDYYIKLENMETGRCDCLNNASFHY